MTQPPAPDPRPPLWEVMVEAVINAPPPTRSPAGTIAAAEIRAVRDWLVPEEQPPVTDDRLARDWTVRMRLRDILTAEADRALAAAPPEPMGEGEGLTDEDRELLEAFYLACAEARKLIGQEVRWRSIYYAAAEGGA